MERCPICGKGFLHKITEDKVFTYKGKELVVKNCVLYKCNICDEGIIDNTDHKRIGKLLKNFKKEVDK
jgi:YgiT-type zinc finger domain-containing protein